jgi:hypothetical protein
MCLSSTGASGVGVYLGCLTLQCDVNRASIVQGNEIEIHFNASINGRLGIVRTNTELNFIMTLGPVKCDGVTLPIGTTVSEEHFASFFRILFLEVRCSRFLRNLSTRQKRRHILEDRDTLNI